MSATLKKIRSLSTPIEKHMYLAALQVRNYDAFYAVLLEATDELLPLVYTPVVGAVCERFSALFPFALEDGRGLFLSLADRGQVARRLRQLRRSIGAIVVTDGQRILGLGDLGINGMGIPIGKLALYTALAGVPPDRCLPITLDVGTDTKSILDDPTYLGTRQRRVKGPQYEEFLDEVVQACDQVFDHPLIQFEDFGNHNAFQLLKRYEDRVCCFNDDIQGTAGVVLAGILAAARITGQKTHEGTFLLFGAGEAAIGIATLLVAEMTASAGLTEDAAKSRIWMIDSKGLVVRGRDHLNAEKSAWAQPHAPVKDLMAILDAVKPTALLGVGAVPGVFTEDVVRKMAALNAKPVIFALSNPTSKAECTAEQCYKWSEGRAVFASGSPFDAVTLNGKTYVPGQANNSFIFPAVGLAVVYTHAKRVQQQHFVQAAHALADTVSQSQLDQGCLFPPLSESREVSLTVATRVAQDIIERGLHRINPVPKPAELKQCIAEYRYYPNKNAKL